MKEQSYNYGWHYVWLNPPRTTTQQQWREVYQWLRVCRRQVHEVMLRG